MTETDTIGKLVVGAGEIVVYLFVIEIVLGIVVVLHLRFDAPVRESLYLQDLGVLSGDTFEQKNLQPDLAREAFPEPRQSACHGVKRNGVMRPVDVLEKPLVPRIEGREEEVGPLECGHDFGLPEQGAVGEDSHPYVGQALDPSDDLSEP